MSKETMIPLSFQIIKIVTDKFATYGEIEPDHGALSFFAGVDFQINKTDYSVRCTFEFGVKSYQKTFVEISVSVYYQVREDSWESLPIIEGKKEFPPAFATHLGQSAMSTARGILHVKTEGTLFNQYFIPDLDVESLVKTRLIIE